MSAITETEPGGEMVCILGFEARPRDSEGQPGTGQRRAFSIGEHVRYISHYFVNKPEDNPIGYMALFEPIDAKDKNHYAATQNYFVTLDCWEDLKEHFASNLIVTERGETNRSRRHSYMLIQIKGKSAHDSPKSRGGG